MTTATFFKFLVFACLFNLTACADNFTSVVEMEVINEYPGTDQRLWVYFTRYENAAAKRGYDIDLNAEAIRGTIEKMNHTGAVGLCNHRADKPNELVIDSGFWKRASDSRRELIVFHELGHCDLKRTHNEDSKAGICQSIMRSGATGCLDFYNQNTRENLLNELFTDF